MIITVFLASALLAARTSATPSLSVEVTSAPSFVNDVDDMAVTATITNTGDERLKLLRDPHSPLSPFQSDVFTVNNLAGLSAQFNGAHVKYTFTADGKSEQGFVTLSPGQSIAVVHDLSGIYNFTTTGSGEYTFEASNQFHYVDATGSVQILYASRVSSARVTIGDKLASTRPLWASSVNRSKWVSCSSSQQGEITTSLTGVTNYLAGVTSYLAGLKSGTPRYTTWFGKYSASQKSTVTNHYQKIKSSDPKTYTYDCSCKSDAFAYVYPENFGYIYLCNAYWKAPYTGTDSKAGTIVHESSHFTLNGGTSDYQYGQTKCKDLAKTNPGRAIMNADSHEYFAENNPSQS